MLNISEHFVIDIWSKVCIRNIFLHLTSVKCLLLVKTQCEFKQFMKRPLRQIKSINYDNTFQIVDKRLHKWIKL